MANIKYFAECNGQAVELTAVAHNGSPFISRASDFTGRCTCGARHQATRMIERKANPSRHVCDSRCVNATGRVMKCECACGGKNHGRGSFTCTAGEAA